jgi:hypothetical protein
MKYTGQPISALMARQRMAKNKKMLAIVRFDMGHVLLVGPST